MVDQARLPRSPPRVSIAPPARAPTARPEVGDTAPHESSNVAATTRGDLFLTDGGIETTLIFHQGLDLPEFAAFVLLDNEEGVDQLRRYYEPYLALARESGAGFVLESPTWRANPIWADRV
jgi:S-methylmethionine-dependent homocysteine/selenocysteine methylase